MSKYTFSIYFFYLNANYRKNKVPVIFILKIWLQEKNKALQKVWKNYIFCFNFFPVPFFSTTVVIFVYCASWSFL